MTIKTVSRYFQVSSGVQNCPQLGTMTWNSPRLGVKHAPSIHFIWFYCQSQEPMAWHYLRKRPCTTRLPIFVQSLQIEVNQEGLSSFPCLVWKESVMMCSSSIAYFKLSKVCLYFQEIDSQYLIRSSINHVQRGKLKENVAAKIHSMPWQEDRCKSMQTDKLANVHLDHYAWPTNISWADFLC